MENRLLQLPALRLSRYGVCCVDCIQKSKGLKRAGVLSIVLPTEGETVLCERCGKKIESNTATEEILTEMAIMEKVLRTTEKTQNLFFQSLQLMNEGLGPEESLQKTGFLEKYRLEMQAA